LQLALLKTPGKGHLERQTPASAERRLDPERFPRIHRSFIRSFIAQLDRPTRLERTGTDGRVAALHGDARMPVSNSGYARSKEAMGKG
jgi:DNA-binding LytR/AlgR family response regulator